MESKDRAPYEWLALRCQSGETGAFEDLIAVMERPLLYYAASLTGSMDSALDVLQEVWIKVFRGIRKLKDPGALRSWLYSIAHGIAVDRIRKNYSREQAEKVQYEDFQEAEEPSFAGEDAAAIHDGAESNRPSSSRGSGPAFSRRLVACGDCKGHRLLRRHRQVAHPLCQTANEDRFSKE